MWHPSISEEKETTRAEISQIDGTRCLTQYVIQKTEVQT